VAIGLGNTADLIDLARPVADCLAASGYRTYVVGGLVRDLQLGATSSHDVDITTDALPVQVKSAVGHIADKMWTQGERFGTIGIRVDGVDFEITTHRSEVYEPSSRKPEVHFSTAIEADLSRRDFTVNAMAFDVSSGSLIDPFGGAADLARGVLRTPGSPEQSFNDDPLRMLRAARFHSRYGLKPASDLESAMKRLSSRLLIVSQERIREETAKLLATPAPGNGVRLLTRTGLLERMVDHYRGEVGYEVADLVDAVSPGAVARLGAFYLVVAEDHGLARVREHMVLRRYSTQDQKNTVSILGAALMALDGDVFGSEDSGVRVFLERAQGLDSAALELAGLQRLGGQAAVSRFRKRMVELARSETLGRLEPALTGDEVMRELGVDSGPAVGRALDYLRSVRVERGEVSRAAARELLARWWEHDQEQR